MIEGAFILAAIFAAFVGGILYAVRYGTSPRQNPISGYLAEIDGSPPRWSVDHLASQIATAICRVEEQHKARVVSVVRATHVQFVPHRFLPNNPGVDVPSGNFVAVYRPSGLVVVMDGPGWERRLAWALNQRVRIELHGMPVHAKQEPQTPAFAAGDTAAKEVADGIVQRREDGTREFGAVVAG